MGVPYAEVIGDPIAHSKSPLIHKFWLRKLGIEGDYRAVRVTAEDLPTYFECKRTDPDWRGCNITSPHKIAAVELVDGLCADAVIPGAINLVFGFAGRLIGNNTDVAGVSACLPPYPIESACVIGAGGAAKAAVATLRRRNVQDIRVLARSVERALLAIEPVQANARYFPFDEAAVAIKSAQVVIQATPLGMRDRPELPAGVMNSLDEAHPHAAVLEMNYLPQETSFLRKARDLGFAWFNGLDMLMAQAEEAFWLFFAARAPREHDAELRELLTR